MMPDTRFNKLMYQFIKNPLSEPVRVGRGLINGKIKGSGWLEVNKYRKQRLKSLQ